jgi:hypothetical protein
VWSTTCDSGTWLVKYIVWMQVASLSMLVGGLSSAVFRDEDGGWGLGGKWVVEWVLKYAPKSNAIQGWTSYALVGLGCVLLRSAEGYWDMLA